jgi:hypothetical protein
MNKKIGIDEVVQLIESNSSQTLGYEELCLKTSLSVRELIDLFREKNTTPMMFIRSIKNKSVIEKNMNINNDTYIKSFNKL